jgi:hypothetical protein
VIGIKLLIFTVLFICFFGLAAMLMAGLLLGRPEKPPEGIDSWLTTDGTVRGSAIAAVSRYAQLPWFDFSYVVDGEYYSGTFMLSANRERADELLREMDQKRFQLSYDPARPSKFYITEQTIKGCEVKFRSGASLTP